MDEEAKTVVVGRRRSAVEVAGVVAEYEASGLSRVAFCQRKGLSLATLARYRKRHPHSGAVPGSRWVAVEVSGRCAGQACGAGSGLAVALADGRRIEVGAGFDAPTLARLVNVLERI
jgi:hypothetical protein